MTKSKIEKRRPWGLRWRASVWFATLVVGCGVATDLLVYSIPIPFIPFQLQKLHYNNVSSRVGWLLFAYSGGLVLSTPPLAMLSERYSARRLPLIVGLVALIGSQIMFMEAPTYWVLCLARVLQGVSSSAVWIVGLALLCDTTPEINIGRQLGLATSGLSVGLLLGPPVGGALYKPFGIRGPIIFGICVTLLDLLGRLLIIERKDALRWGYDPAAIETTNAEQGTEASGEGDQSHTAKEDLTEKTHSGAESGAVEQEAHTIGEEARHSRSSSPEGQKSRLKLVDTPASIVARGDNALPIAPLIASPKPSTISLLGVLVRLGRSPRALAAFVNTFLFAISFVGPEPALPLHMQKVWGFDSTKVGLISIAAVVPTLASSPLAGWLADRYGTGWVTCGGLLAAQPWWILQIIPNHLALFIVSYALASFFTAGVLAPLTAELAAVAQTIDGVGYAHVYGAFNLAYGIGSAVGPLIGGQIYDAVKHGWSAVIFTAVGALCLAFVLAFVFSDSVPLLKRLQLRRAKVAVQTEKE